MKRVSSSSSFSFVVVIVVAGVVSVCVCVGGGGGVVERVYVLFFIRPFELLPGCLCYLNGRFRPM